MKSTDVKERLCACLFDNKILNSRGIYIMLGLILSE